MMKRPLYLIIAAVVLTLVVLFALSFVIKKPKSTTTKPTATIITSNLYDLVSKGGNNLCMLSISEGSAKMSGAVYITDGKFAADFQTVAQGTGINSHMMGNGETVYSWSDFTDLPGNSMTYAAFQSPANKTGLIYQKTKYSCTSWTPEDSMFKLPKGIKFNTQ